MLIVKAMAIVSKTSHAVLITMTILFNGKTKMQPYKGRCLENNKYCFETKKVNQQAMTIVVIAKRVVLNTMGIVSATTGMVLKTMIVVVFTKEVIIKTTYMDAYTITILLLTKTKM